MLPKTAMLGSCYKTSHMMQMSFKRYDAGCKVRGGGNKQKLTLAFHMVMVAVSPGGTRMMGVPFTILLLCCGAAACWSDLQALDPKSLPC
jgi:type 1 fimbria pilin